MPRPQTKRNLWAVLNGLTRKVDSYTGGKQKRLEATKDVVFAGSNQSYKLRDPVGTVEPLVLRIVCTKDDPFIEQANALFRAHLRNPDGAGAVTLYSQEDDESINGSKTYTKAAIEDVGPPEGDRNSADIVYIEITVCPEDGFIGE